MDATTNPHHNPTDIVVIGAGIAGLVAAGHAARLGRNVTLVERGEPGGRGRSPRNANGYCHGHGPHALYTGQHLHRALSHLGVEVTGAPPPLRGAMGLVDQRLGLLPGGAVSLMRSDLVPGRAKPQLAKLLASLQRVDPTHHAHQSVDQWLDELALKPEVRRLIEALVRLTTYCADHDIGSADAAIAQVKLGLSSGVLYLDGGWQQIVDGLVGTCRELGVRFVERCAATHVDGTTVTLDDSRTLQASAVVVAGLSPEAVAGLVVGSPDLRPDAGPPVAAATLDVGIVGEAAVGFILGIDEPLYYSRHDPPASLAPPGHSLYGLMRYLRHGESHDHTSTRSRLEALARTAGIDAAQIAEIHYSHRLTVAHGQPLAARGGMAGRPAVDALEMSGVYLAGDWVGSEGLLADAAAASAVEAAHLAAVHCATGVGPGDRGACDRART